MQPSVEVRASVLELSLEDATHYDTVYTQKPLFDIKKHKPAHPKLVQIKAIARLPFKNVDDEATVYYNGKLSIHLSIPKDHPLVPSLGEKLIIVIAKEKDAQSS